MDKTIKNKLITSPFLWIGVALLLLINIFSYHKKQQVEKEAIDKINMMVLNVSTNNINTFKIILSDYIEKVNYIATFEESEIRESIAYLVNTDSIFRNIEIINTPTPFQHPSSYEVKPVLETTSKYLQITTPLTDSASPNKKLSLKIPLEDLHNKIAENESFSYAYLTLSHNNSYIYHPNELKIGHLSEKPKEELEEVKEKTISKTFSDYLDIPVYTYYETLEIGGNRYTITANVPHISFDELVTNIRLAFLYMAISVSLGIAFILFIGISAWQREVMKRQNVEKDKIKLQLKNELQTQQVLANELEQLKTGLNPHFLFNSLGSLKVLVDKKPEEAKQFAIALSNLYRYLLKQQNHNLTTLKEELKFSKDYIYLQQIRFSERIKTTIQIDDNLLDSQLPPMSLQLLIENCIKHTIKTQQNPLVIEIYTATNYLIVKNNYNPPAHIHTSKIGLKNLIKRYAHLTEQPCSFRIENSQFVAKIPLI